MTETIETDQNSSQINEKLSMVKIGKILIHNFLSFDYGEIELDPQLTIAYGPNGSGKSTIYQALKFVLGSNDYDGRYTKWSNFIRSGEESAFVQVHIHANGEEFIIKRDVQKDKSPKFYFKDAISQDLKPVRGDTIRDFVENIGLNPDNIFSFMSQGSIDSIKDFKEETLCGFIEKGIGLESLRSEILNEKSKIEDLKKNYESLEARKENMQFQLISLQPKLKKLEMKIELEDELDILEKELLWAEREEIIQRIKEYKDKIDNLNNDIKNIIEKITRAEEKIKKTDSEYAVIKSETESLKSEASEKKGRKKSIEEQLIQFNKENNEIAEKIENIEELLQEKTSNKQNLVIEEEKIDKKIKEIKKIIDNHNKEIDKLEREQLDLITRSQEHQALILEYELNNQKISNLNEKLKDTVKEHEDSEEKILKKLTNIKKLNHDLEEYNWFMKDPSEKLENKYQEAYTKYHTRIDIIKEELSQLQNQYEQIVKKIESVKRSVYSKDMPKPKSIQRMIDIIHERNIDRECFGPLIDFISFDEIYQMAIQSIFGYRVLYSFIAKNSDVFHRLKRIAQDSKAKVNIYMERKQKIPMLPKVPSEGKNGIFGYLANKIIPQNPNPAIQKVIHSRAGKTLVVKDHVVGTDYIKRYQFSDWIVTLDGEQIRPKKLVIEARPFIQDKNSYNFSSVSQSKNYLLELEDQAEKNRKHYNEKNNNLLKLEKKSLAIDKRLRQIGTLLHQYRRMEITINSKDALIDKRKTLFKKKKSIQQEIKEIQINLENIKNKLPNDIYEKQQYLKEIPEKIKKFKLELEQYQQSFDNFQEQKSELEKQILILDTEIIAKKEEKSEFENSLKQKDSEYFNLMQESMALTKDISLIEKNIEQIKEKIQEYEDKIEEQRAIKNNYDMDKIKIEAEIKNLNRYIQEKEEKLIQIQEEFERNDFKLEFEEIRDISDIKKDIFSINRELTNYRDVDRSLFTKKKEIEETIDSIDSKQGQIKDEIKAAEDAERELERKYYIKFKQSLQKLELGVNQKVNDAELGFSTNIELQGDITELGVAVFTTFKLQSGQKDTRKLSALSGGQRSMVGICLMLSLNQLNPSPFNIYDEVEMFLDPNNAQTVAKLIHNLTCNGLQFVILMPDPKRTLIQLANRVLGVCLNGKNGCSTVLKGNFTCEDKEE